MHYVICYDISGDRLRDRVAKTLEKNGCHRIQKSVFVATYVEKKHWMQLEASLHKLFERRPLQPDDHLHVWPLGEAAAGQTRYYGHNNAFTRMLIKRKKTLL